MQFSQVGKKIQVRVAYGDAFCADLKSKKFKWNAEEKLWEKGFTKALWEWLEGVKKQRTEFATEINRRKSAGLFFTHVNSYDCRQAIKDLGGMWDKTKKSWLMPSFEAMQSAQRLCDEYAISTAIKPDKPLVLSFIEPEYGKEYQTGQFFKKDGAWQKVARTQYQDFYDGTEVFYRPATVEETNSIEATLAKNAGN